MLVDDNNALGLLFGRIVQVDAKTCRIKVLLEDRDGMVTHWLHVPQKNTHKNEHRSLPDLGAHCTVLMAKNGIDGVFLGSIYSDSHMPPITDDDTEFVRFEDGSTVSYNRNTHQWKLDCVGTVSIKATSVNISGSVNVSGNINATGSVIDGGGNTNNHTH